MDAEMEFEAFSDLTAIQKFFYGQNVFLTGVTGLVGKVILEKLLRSCPGIGMIYLHMRPKKGLSPEQRLEKLFKLDLFKGLKEVFPLFWKRVHVVEGDISEPKLGISFEDYEKICNNVTIVLHSAASVNFNDPIKMATNHNVRSTDHVIKMCHDIHNIKAVVHVSTAYVRREHDKRVLEKIPKTKVDPRKLMESLEWMDEGCQKAVTDFLTDKILTTYLVTKALAEVLIDQERGDLPIAIVRPAYIGPTHKEPFPGWIDSIQGISGLLLAGAKGALRTLRTVKGLRINIVPVDIVANAVISSAWHVGITKPPSVFIVNVVFDHDALPEAAEEFLPYVLSKRDEYPLVNIFRYPDFTIYYNSVAYKIHSFFDQWVPAVIIDTLLFIFTGRTILLKVYSKISFLYDIFYRLGKDPWLCVTDNMVFLKNSLEGKDSEIFDIDTNNFDWYAYADACLIGGRKYLALEEMSNVSYAKKKAKIWYAVTTTLKWFLILYFLYYLLSSSFFTPIYESLGNKLHPLQS